MDSRISCDSSSFRITRGACSCGLPSIAASCSSSTVRAWRDFDLAQYGADGTCNSEVQAIVCGRDLALVGYPGDSFVELGLAMKQNSPFALTFVSEQSGNGAISYIPNEKAFPEGSYEVDSARVAPGGGEVLANAAIRLLTELFPRP